MKDIVNNITILMLMAALVLWIYLYFNKPCSPKPVIGTLKVYEKCDGERSLLLVWHIREGDKEFNPLISGYCAEFEPKGTQ